MAHFVSDEWQCYRPVLNVVTGSSEQLGWDCRHERAVDQLIPSRNGNTGYMIGRSCGPEAIHFEPTAAAEEKEAPHA